MHIHFRLVKKKKIKFIFRAPMLLNSFNSSAEEVSKLLYASNSNIYLKSESVTKIKIGKRKTSYVLKTFKSTLFLYITS